MAIVNADAQTQTTGGTSGFKKADAFLNISIVDANGNAHPLPKGIALMADGRKIEKALIKKARELELSEDEDAKLELTLVATIHFPEEDDGTEIAL